MRYPNFIKEGDQIGFPAPSFGCNIEPYSSQFDSALEYFKDKGFKLNPGPNSKAGLGVGISNTPENCAKELTDMFLDPANDALICCGGGELMCEILEHVALKWIEKSDAKWIMGYSDITNIELPLLTLCDTASIYGPCANAFGLRKLHEGVASSLDIMCGKRNKVHSFELHEKYFYEEEPKDETVEEDPLAPEIYTEKSLKSVYDGKTFHGPGEFDGKLVFSGRLIGGCMDCLDELLGTPYEDVKGFLDRYASDGIIWCLEACDLNVFSIRRAMWHFEQAGWFKKGIIKGFLIGRHRNGQEMMGLNHFGSVMPYIEKLGVPAVLDIDLGHVAPAMPVVWGSIGHVNVSCNELELEMEFA